MFAVLKGAIKNIQAKDIAEIIIINYVEAKKKENLDIKSMTNNFNASINILREGLKTLSAGTVEYTDGDPNKNSVKKHKSMTSEAQPIAYGVGG